jgi:SAM-dependent methyltransferase
MNHSWKNKIIDNYRNLFFKFGEGPAVGQWSIEGQRFRFEKLSEIGCLSRKNILEIGCGLGDFYPYLLKNFGEINYTGIDIVPELINSAKQKYPDASFYCLDLFENDFNRKYDWVFISGVFNNDIHDATQFLLKMITVAYDLCEIGLGFNFTSKFVNRNDKEMAYHDPFEVFKFCVESLSKKVTISHHYERCDVVVFVYR